MKPVVGSRNLTSDDLVATCAHCSPQSPALEPDQPSGWPSADRHGERIASRSSSPPCPGSARLAPTLPDNRGMGELPAGTITMLFSDIEGSTALLRRLGDRYADALSAQRVLLRAAFADCGGQEMGTEGDSFFVVFGSAADAVRCCVAAQRALYGHDWPGGIPVRVRMGLHSGEPVRYEDGYVGLDVHRAARIAAVAHGGQVVLSEATRQLAGAQLPAGVSLRDLGLHRLKDIDA